MPVPSDVISISDIDLENAIDADTQYINNNILMYGSIAAITIALVIYLKRR